MVLLDLHPATTPISALTPFQLVVNEVEIDGKMSRYAFHMGDQRGAVRFAGSPKAQHTLSIAEFSVTMTNDALIAETRR